MKSDKLRPGIFVGFVKVFLLYIFFEYFLSGLSENGTYQYFIKFLGDGLLVIFVLLTLVKVKRLAIYRGQKVSIILFFVLIAAISAIANELTALDVFLGVRSLLRYYTIYFLSYYYDIREDSFKKISRFIVTSFYFEIVIFAINYFVYEKISVLSQGYLPMAMYLNAVAALILYENRFSLMDMLVLSLVVMQSILSTSRLAVLGLSVQVMIYVVLNRKRLNAKIYAIGAIILISLIFIALMPSEETKSEVLEKVKGTKLDAGPESNFRLYLLSRFIRISLERPNLIGDGPNTFGSPYSRLNREEYYYNYGFDPSQIRYTSDSDFTSLLMQLGFIGVITYFLFIYLLYRETRQEYRGLILLYMSSMLIGLFAIPVLSMRISSFAMFVLIALTHRGANSND